MFVVTPFHVQDRVVLYASHNDLLLVIMLHACHVLHKPLAQLQAHYSHVDDMFVVP